MVTAKKEEVRKKVTEILLDLGVPPDRIADTTNYDDLGLEMGGMDFYFDLESKLNVDLTDEEWDEFNAAITLGEIIVVLERVALSRGGEK